MELDILFSNQHLYFWYRFFLSLGTLRTQNLHRMSKPKLFKNSNKILNHHSIPIWIYEVKMRPEIFWRKWKKHVKLQIYAKKFDEFQFNANVPNGAGPCLRTIWHFFEILQFFKLQKAVCFTAEAAKKQNSCIKKCILNISP